MYMYQYAFKTGMLIYRLISGPKTNFHQVPYTAIAMKRHNLTCKLFGGEEV